jgi:hypothetical protein
MEFFNIKRRIHGDCEFFELNDPTYSIFSYEKEILLRDGLLFKVIDVSD